MNQNTVGGNNESTSDYSDDFNEENRGDMLLTPVNTNSQISQVSTSQPFVAPVTNNKGTILDI